MSATAELPELTGSPKQIAWATDIRNEYLHDILEREYRDWRRRAIDKDRFDADFEEIRVWLRAQTAASWWIEHRWINAALRAAHGAIRQQRGLT